MSNPLSYTLTNNTVTVFSGKVYTVAKEAPNFRNLVLSLIEGRWDMAEKYLTPAKSIEEWSGNVFKVVDGIIRYHDESLPVALTSRILELVGAQEDPRPLLRFWTLLCTNPSMHSIEQLFTFLRHQNIPIATDGYILGYKSVRPDMTDHHTGKYKNNIGAANSMPRNQVADDPRYACHAGFHVGSLEYAASFGGSDSVIVIVKVNPADVVSVPFDCNNQKMRVCAYSVLKRYDGPLPSTVYKYQEDEQGYEEEECEEEYDDLDEYEEELDLDEDEDPDQGAVY